MLTSTLAAGDLMEQYLARNKALFIMQLRICSMPNEDTKGMENEIDTQFLS